MPYILALDQGTHASRACLYNTAGEQLMMHSEDIELQRIDQHRVEQNPQQIIGSLQNCIAAALQYAASDAETISACGLAIQRSSVLAWQTNGEPLSPVLSWQDTRAEQKLAALQSRADDIQRITGLPLSAHYGASKLAWLQDQFSNTRDCRLTPLVSYVLFHLLAQQPCITDHVNAQRTQLFSLIQRNWSEELCELFGVQQQRLPACVPVLHDYGMLAVAPIPLTAVSGDQNAAIYAGGRPAADTALVNIGTGAFVLLLTDKLADDTKQLSGIACSDANNTHYLREATINGAGSALQWLQQQYPETDIQPHLAEWLRQESTPAVFINTIGGLGSPWWNSQTKARFLYADNTSDRNNVAAEAVAVVESIVFMIHANLQRMRESQTVARIRVSSGLSHQDGLCQRLADLTGLPVERCTHREATARGIAWLASGQAEPWRSDCNQVFHSQQHPDLQQRYQLFLAAVNKLM